MLPSAHEDTAVIDAPAASSPKLRPGDLVGRYSVERLLGVGGMGEVYLAKDVRLGRAIALKIARALERATPDCGLLCSLLMREAQALARLSHPNIVTVHDVGEHAGCVYLAMEFVDGPTLRDWAPGRNWQERLAALLEAGAALGAAHGAQLVHGDFKPDNVLVSASSRVVVTDFGLARTLSGQDGSPDYTCGCSATAKVGVNLDALAGGTLRYMPIEQQEGRADARSDQFSFAVSVWEILYGSLPFSGERVEELRDAITGQRITPPPADTPVPPAVADALRRGLREQPSMRYPNMASFVSRLADAPR